MKHAVIRTDRLSGTIQSADLVSVKHMVDGVATAIDNGNIVKLNGLMKGEREVFEGVVPAASDRLEDVVVIASVEVMYDETKRDLADYFNEEGKVCRGYYMRSGNIFSVTAEALESIPVVGDKVCLGDSTKLQVAGEGTPVGTVIAIDVVGRYTYYVIQVI